MPSVHVNFLGVCTIFQNLPSQVPPGFQVPPNRVVLVLNYANLPIEPHIPKIEFIADQVNFNGPALPPTDPPKENEFLLQGVTLSILNPVAIPSFQPALSCLPGLQANLIPPAQLSPPASLVYIPDPTKAAAWFDVSEGVSWNSYVMNVDTPCPTVPSISVLNIDTDGNPQLLVTPWDTQIPPTTVTLTRLNDAPGINVTNFAGGTAVKDDPNDFLLNYLTAETFPGAPAINIPTMNICTTPSPDVFHLPRCGDAGPGCSNSTYP